MHYELCIKLLCIDFQFSNNRLVTSGGLSELDVYFSSERQIEIDA